MVSLDHPDQARSGPRKAGHSSTGGPTVAKLQNTLMNSFKLKLRHYRDAAALLSGGLSPRTRLVSPLVPDHRYQMVLSRYLFACRYAQGQSILDFGSGSGFGSEPLREAGGTRYLGLEEFDRPVRHALKKYGSAQVSYRRTPLSAPGGDLGHHGLVLAFDLLARYRQSESLLQRISGHVEDNGRLVVGVPLVASKQDIRAAFAAGAQTALYPWYWRALCTEQFRTVRYFRHCGPNAILDWNEPSPSPFDATDFRFEEEESAELLRTRPGLSAFFVCSDPIR